MHVGAVCEIKNHEYRVGLTAESVRELVARCHEVLGDTGAAAAAAAAAGASGGAPKRISTLQTI